MLELVKELSLDQFREKWSYTQLRSHKLGIRSSCPEASTASLCKLNNGLTFKRHINQFWWSIIPEKSTKQQEETAKVKKQVKFEEDLSSANSYIKFK